MKTPPLDAQIVGDAVVDWVSASDFTGAAYRAGLTDPLLIRDLALGIMVRLILEGILFPLEDGSSDMWKCTPAEAVERVVRRWNKVSGPDALDEPIVWLTLTPEGERLGAEYRRKWSEWFLG